MVTLSLRTLCIVCLSSSMAFAQFGGSNPGGGLGGGNQVSRRINTDGISINSPSEKLTQALQMETPIELIDVPLSDAVEFVANVIDMPVILDQVALAEEGLTPDESVTLLIQGIPLHQALDLLLTPHGLTYLGEGNVLKITTQIVADETFELRTYDVSDLLEGELTEDALVSMIQSTTHVSWMDFDGEGGHVEVLNGLMLMSQTQQTHRKVAEILSLVRKSKEQQLAVAATKTSIITYRVYAPGEVVNEKTPAIVQQPLAEGATEDMKIPVGVRGTKLATDLAEIIPQMIAPESWEKAEIHAVEGAIIVKQTGDVQMQIKLMLSPFLQEDLPRGFGCGYGFAGGMAQEPVPQGGGFFSQPPQFK